MVPPAVPSQTNHRILAENPRQHSRKCSLDLVRLSHVEGGEGVAEPQLAFWCFNLLTFDSQTNCYGGLLLLWLLQLQIIHPCDCTLTQPSNLGMNSEVNDRASNVPRATNERH